MRGGEKVSKPPTPDSYTTKVYNHHVMNVMNSLPQQNWDGLDWKTQTLKQLKPLEESSMKQIMNVIVVKGEEIVIEKSTVATTEEEAKYNVGVYKYLEDNKLTFDDITIDVQKRGVVQTTKAKF